LALLGPLLSLWERNSVGRAFLPLSRRERRGPIAALGAIGG
jgi:hypothetical protein